MYAGTTADDPAFNTVGWESSYTGEPISAEEMRVFRDSRVERVLELGPQDVLEIGCGTGLLLLKIAPHCASYHGADFSQPVLDSLAAAVARQRLTNVTLSRRHANDVSGLTPQSFDLVVLNSVIQYFPSVEYLMEVLDGATRLLRPGGAIFVGDVRNLQLWDAFHADVRQFRARASLQTAELREMIRARLAQEKELLIDPAFFHALAARRGVGDVEISLQRGARHNELNQFRYDVLLRVGGPARTRREVAWNVWDAASCTLESLRARLAQERPDVLGYLGVPNSRVARPMQIVEALASEEVPATVGELRVHVAAHARPTVDPEDLFQLAESLDYRASVTWSCSQPGRIDVLFTRNGAPSEAVCPPPADIGTRPLADYANRPLRGVLNSELTGMLRAFLQERLPAYMLPSAFVFLDDLPLTANGKVDRRALRPPSADRPELTEYVAPRNESERMLADIWSEILGLERVGVNDNFFELGGDSILSIQVVSRIRARGLHCTPLQMFQNQTIGELGRVLERAARIVADQGAVTGPVPLTPIQHWFLEAEPVSPHHFTQSLMFEVHGRLYAEALEACLQGLVAHHDALRLTLTRHGATWTQSCSAVNVQPCLSVFDLSAIRDDEVSAAIEERCAEFQARLDLTSGLLLRAAYFTLGDRRPGRLFLLIHHFAVDGVSWRILLEDLYALYRQRGRGKTLSLPAKTTSLQEWTRRLSDYARADQLAEEAPYWLRLHESAAAGFPVDAPRGENTVASARRLASHLDEQRTEALLRDVPAVYHTQINDVLLAALLEAFQTWTGRDRLFLDLEGHGREELFPDVDVSRTVGWFTSLYPVLLRTTPGAGSGELLKSVKEQLRAVPRQGVGYGVLRYLGAGPVRETLRHSPRPEIAFNYFGQVDRGLTGQIDLLKAARESRGPERPPAAERPYVVEVSAFVAAGRLQLSWEYSEHLHTRASVEAFAEAFTASLGRIIGHCLTSGVGGYTPSDFPLARIDQARLDALSVRVGRIEDLYPLTPTQEGLMFHTLMEPDSGVYVLQHHGLLEGDVDVTALAAAWRQVMARHELLRTSFETEGLERPLQVVHPTARLPLVEDDWRHISAEEQERRWKTLLVEDRDRNFDVTRPPLMRLTLIRLGSNRCRFVWSQHHLLSDGWSHPQLLKEVFVLYEAARRGRTVELPTPRPYRDYVALLESQDGREAAEAWRKHLAGFAERTRLGIDRGSAGAVPDVRFAFGGLGAEETERAEAFAREHQITLNTLVQAAFALVLSRYSGREDVVFGETVSGRSANLRGVESLIGPTINTLPVRVRFAPRTPVLAWLKGLQQQSAELRHYEAYPLVKIQRFSQVPAGTPLFEYLYVFQNQPPADAASVTAEMSVQVREMAVEEVTSYALTFVAARHDRIGRGTSVMTKRLLVLGTRNRKKGLELAELLGPYGFELRTVSEVPNSIEIEETGSSFAENAALKATLQARNLAAWVLAEDSGLCVEALHEAPGIYSARFSGPNASDEANNAKLLTELGDLPAERRGAFYVCYATLAAPDGSIRAESEGRCYGRIRLDVPVTQGCRTIIKYFNNSIQ